MSKGLIVFLFISFLSVLHSRAQINSVPSDLFDLYILNNHLLNPSNSDTTYKLKLNFGNKSETGLFEGVSKLYVDGDYKIQLSQRRNYHYFGFQIINNKEGEFISKNHLFGRYSWRLDLSDYTSMSAGISLGVINYSFRSSQAGGGGSDFVPDGNLGLSLNHKTFYTGFSIQHVFSPQIKPVDQEYILERYYNIILQKSFILNQDFQLNTNLYYGFAKPDYYRLSFASLVSYKEVLEAGINLRQKRGVIFIAGIKTFRVGSSSFSFYASFLSRSGKVRINDNSIEFFLAFKI